MRLSSSQLVTLCVCVSSLTFPHMGNEQHSGNEQRLKIAVSPGSEKSLVIAIARSEHARAVFVTPEACRIAVDH